MKQSKPTFSIRVSPRKAEAGMALVLVLLLLLLVSAIGLGMVFMSNTESAVNANYRDSQLSFFAMRSGMDEARDRIRQNSPWPIAPPTTMPGTAGSIIYITNPAAGEVVTPTVVGSKYFDDEFCHEYFATLAGAVSGTVNNPGAGVPCTAALPAGSVTVASISPNTGTASAVKFKWARITLKQNATFAAPNGALNAGMYVDSADIGDAFGTQPYTQVCYQSINGNEIPVTRINNGAYATCAQAFALGIDAGPVYVVTSLAVTPNGSRRMGQYEVATLNVQGPPVALGMDGPAAVYSPVSHSNNFFISGTDAAQVAGYAWNGPASSPCTPSGPKTVPAITTGDANGVTNIDGTIAGTNPTYSGCTNTLNPCTVSNGSGPPLNPPSVVNGGATSFAGWSSPTDLDNLVRSLGNQADVTYSCGIGGVANPTNGVTAACSPAGALGTDASPQVTYVNGDFNYGNASGAGVLIVTGTLSFTGNATFDGLILVIGQGAMSENGGGNGGFNGSVFLANTRPPGTVAPLAVGNPFTGELGTLGTPKIGWNGGGKSFIQYNSCWAAVKSNHVFYPIATREEMY